MNAADEDEVGNGESGGNEMNLLNLSTSKRSTRAGYLTSGGAKRGGGNTKKGVKATKGYNYLIPSAKKTFNHLQHMFTQVSFFQHFDLE